MSRKKTKCGKFIVKDGIVVKRREGKSFVCPDMPEKMKIPYPDQKKHPSVPPMDYVRACRGIDQMNSLKEFAWQLELRKKYAAIRRLYYFQQLVKFCRRTARNFLRGLLFKKFFEKER